MSKKWIAILTIMTFSCIPAMGINAMDLNTNRVSSESTLNEEEKSMYITRSGEITSLTTEGKNFEILVGNEMNGTRLIIQPGQIILDVETLEMKRIEDLKEGMNVTAVINKDTPMTMSLPPLCSGQEVILINSSKKNTEIAYFDENLTNEANTLMLNVSEGTVIQNSRGERRIFTAEDIKNQNAIVVYTNSTRSIPAQTTPEYVLILCDDESEEEKTIEESQSADTNGAQKKNNYITVRELAQQLEYKVEWNNTAKTVELSKENDQIVLTVGQSSYVHNGKKMKLEDIVKLENDTVYVPEEFWTVLK